VARRARTRARIPITISVTNGDGDVITVTTRDVRCEIVSTRTAALIFPAPNRRHIGNSTSPPSTSAPLWLRWLIIQLDIRPSCVHRGWSDRLERTRQRSARSRSRHRQLRSPTEDASVSAVLGAPSALEALCNYALLTIDVDIISTFKIALQHLETDPRGRRQGKKQSELYSPPKIQS